MSDGSGDRWQLRVPLPVLWRPDGALQLGLEPPAGLVLGRLPRAAGRVLEALHRPCGDQRLRQLAGPAAGDWLPGLIGSLHRAGLLCAVRPPPGRVVLIGSGRVLPLVARLLLASVAQPVRVICPDVPAPPEAITRLQRRHPGRLGFAPDLGAEAIAGAGLIVLVAGAPEADRSVVRQVGDRAHLVVCASDLGASVGPLVVPGRTACLRCEDLHRTDRDPAWPQLLAQLSRPRTGTCRPAEASWAAGTAVLHAEGWLAGELPDSLGVGLELDAGGALRVRALRPHPGCGCRAMS